LKHTILHQPFLSVELSFSSFISFTSLPSDYAGRVKVFEPTCRGTLSETSIQVSHVFRKFPCSSHSELPSSRLDYFMEQVHECYFVCLLTLYSCYFIECFNTVLVQI